MLLVFFLSLQNDIGVNEEIINKQNKWLRLNTKFYWCDSITQQNVHSKYHLTCQRIKQNETIR